MQSSFVMPADGGDGIQAGPNAVVFVGGGQNNRNVRDHYRHIDIAAVHARGVI